MQPTLAREGSAVGKVEVGRAVDHHAAVGITRIVRTGRTLADSVVRLFLKDRPQKIAIPYSDVAGLEFNGRDTAAGKSWAAWVKKYWEKKAAGEAQIELTPEKLD